MAKSLEERVRALEDRDTIAQLQAQYVNFNDGGWTGPTHQHPKAVADLFTADGVWEGPFNTVRAEGAAAIEELFTQFQAIPFIVHYIMNPIIELDGDCARGEWHALVAATTPDGQAFWTFGKYLNEYIRTADGWQYTKMTFDTAAVTSYEKGWAMEQFIGQDPDDQRLDTRQR